MILQKTKRKAELISVEVKCKGLKAQQMLKEAEEEKQRQFWKKQALRSEREQKRLEEEQNTRSELAKIRKAKWMEKQMEIKKMEENVRKKWEKKVVQFETETKQKLDNIDHLKQQRQYLLDLKRKQKWQQKYLYQMKVLEETTRQQERVDAAAETRKKQYEEKMTKVLVKNSAALLDMQTRKEETERQTDLGDKICTKGQCMDVQTTGQTILRKTEPEVKLHRRVSTWIVEEVLYSFGLAEEANLLVSTKSSQGYSNVLDKLIGSAVRKREIANANVLGQQQDILSKIIHFVVRRLKQAYLSVGQRQLNEEMTDKSEDEKFGTKRLFPGVDDTFETEKAVYITLCATLGMDCQVGLEKHTAEEKPRQSDNIATLFANHLRQSETEVRQAEADLSQHLAYFQLKPRTFSEEKEILELFLKLACHEPISTPEFRRNIKSNVNVLPSPGSYGWPVGNGGNVTLRKSSRQSEVSSQENIESEDHKRSKDGDVHGDKEETESSCGLRKEVFMYEGGTQQFLDTFFGDEPLSASVEESTVMSAMTDLSNQQYMENNHGGVQEVEFDINSAECRSNSKDNSQYNSHRNSQQGNQITDERSDMKADIYEVSLQTDNSCSSISKITVDVDTTQNKNHTDKEQQEGKYETPNEESSSTVLKATASITVEASAEAITTFSKPSQSFHPDNIDVITVSPISVEQTALGRDNDHAEAAEFFPMPNDDDTEAALLDTINENSMMGKCDACSKSPSTEDLLDEMNNTGRLCSPKVVEIDCRSGLEEPKKTDEEETLDETALTDPAKDDIVAMTAQFLMKAQQRELLQGIGFQPSKIHNFIALSLSRLWRPRANEDMHVFGEWLDNPDVAEAVGSLISSVKVMRFPQTLLHKLASTIATSLLHNFTDRTRCLPEGVVTSIVRQFSEDLEKDQVSIRILEDVLLTVNQEYTEYLELDHSFTLALFLCDILSRAENLLSSGTAVNTNFVKNIIGYENLPLDAQEKLLCSPWTALLHKAKVSIQLSALTSGDKKKLRDLMMACWKWLTGLDSGDNIMECVELMQTRLNDESSKIKTAVTVSANVVSALLNTVDDRKISSMTLLPGALKSHPAITPCKLGEDTTGEALVLLILDSLVKDLGEDTLDRVCLGHVAVSLVEVFTGAYKYQKEALEGDGLAGGLECMTSRFRCKSLEFTDSCKMISAILRPYLAFVLTEDADLGSKVKLGDRLPVDEDLLSSLFCFVAEVFVTFVSGIIAKMRIGGVGNDLQDDVLVLCVWRTLASLAKEAKILLNGQCQAAPTKAAMTYTLILEGFVDTLVSRTDSKDSSKLPDCGSKAKVEVKDDHLGKDVINTFLAAVLRQLPDPGYILVSDQNIPKQSLKIEPTTLASNKNARKGHQITPDVESAAQREIILASRQILESFVTTEALQTMSVKMADHVACAVFVLERFIASLCNKICALRNELKNGSIAPSDIISFLSTCHSPTPAEIKVDTERAVMIATQVFLEFETLQSSVSILCRLVENLTRIHQRLSGVKVRASSILSVVQATELMLLIKVIVIFTLRAITSLLGTGSIQSTDPLDIPGCMYVMQITTTAYDVIHNEIEDVRDWIDKQKKRNIASIGDDSVLALPGKIRDKVFNYINHVMEFARASVDNADIEETPSPNELVAFIINQILNSVTSQAEAGKFPFFRINDLLRSERSAKAERACDLTQTGSSNAGIRSKNKIKDPIISLERAETKDLLKQLIDIFTGIYKILKEQLNMAVIVNESYDTLLRASVLMNAKLAKVKNNLSRMNIILSNIQSIDASIEDRLNANDPLNVKIDKSGDLSHTCSAPVVSIKPGKLDDKRMSIALYIENLFENITDVAQTNDSSYANQMSVVNEILKACYSFALSCLSCDGKAKSGGGLNPVSVLLLEITTTELYNRLDELKRARTKELDKGTNYPYLFGRQYTTPDPWGPYYPEVAVRARQLADTVKIGSVTRNKFHKLSTVSSLISSREESFVGDKYLDDDEEDSSEVEIQAPVAENDSTDSPDTKVQARVAAWRRKVKDSSAVHNADTTVKAWVKKGTKLTLKLPVFKKDAHSNSFEGNGKAAHQIILDNASKSKEQHIVASQEKSLQKNLQLPRQRSCLAEIADQNVSKSVKKPQFSSFIRKVEAGGEICSSSKQQIKRLPDENKATMKQINSKTCRKVNEAAVKRHVSRLARKNSISKFESKPGLRDSGSWSRTVHIIHHAYAVKPSALTATTTEKDPENRLVEPDKSQNESRPEGVSCSQQEDLRDQPGSVYIYLLISLLANEMPQETRIISRCFDRGTMAILGTDKLVDIISVLDLAMIELGQGDEAKAVRVLEGEGCKERVSQRAAKAINNLLQSVTSSLISDEQIRDKLADIGQNCKDINMQDIRTELITRLSNMAERVKEGCKEQNVFSGHVEEVMLALRQVTETSQEMKGEYHKGYQDGDSYLSDGENISDEYSGESFKMGSHSRTPSCNTVEQNLSVSGDDSNDDKCIISSSWTILSSCPSLSSSRSSNVVQLIKNGSANESASQNSSSVGTSKKCEQSRISGRSYQNDNPGNYSDFQSPGRYSRTDSSRNLSADQHLSERSSKELKKDNHSNDCPLLGRSSKISIPHEESVERHYSSRGSPTDEDKESEHSGRSSRTDSAHTWNERRSGCEDGRYSGQSSGTNSTKTSRCSSANSSPVLNQRTSSRAISVSSVSRSATPSQEHRDTWTSGAPSQTNSNLDHEEPASTDPASELEKMDKSVAVKDRKDTSGQNSEFFGGKQEMSQEYKHSETRTFEISADNHASGHYSPEDDADNYGSGHYSPEGDADNYGSGHDSPEGDADNYASGQDSPEDDAENDGYKSGHDSADDDLDNDGYNSEHSSTGSESDGGSCCDKKNKDTNNLMDVGGGGDVGGNAAGDVEKYNKL